ncbi:MAG: DUF362 domain-containing protein [Fibrobacteria bacterium]|nr:DUF362 domain-containing protein [Fibrobacteria bacterium]
MKNHHHHCPEKHSSRFSKILWLLWPIMGLATIIWVLVRVIPKPSRLSYPCMQASAPIATSFLAWLFGLMVTSFAALGHARFLAQGRGRLASIGIGVAALMVVFVSFGPLESIAKSMADKPVFVPTDSANTPVGTARGIFPGRVVWAYDPGAAHWSAEDGTFWWEEDQTDYDAVADMLSSSIKTLTGTDTDADAWDAMFKYFNENHGKGEVGYESSEKIAIKININECTQDHGNCENWSYFSPPVIIAMVKQLVDVAGVTEGNIVIFDAIRMMPSTIYDPIHSEYPAVRFADIDGGDGREKSNRDSSLTIHWSGDLGAEMGGPNPTFLPDYVTEAEYIINMAGMKGHQIASVTLCAKNHLGTILADVTGYPANQTPKGAGIHPSITTHDFSVPGLDQWQFPARPMESYNALVDLMGHKDLGEKTLLFLSDGLYATQHQNAPVAPEYKWQSAPFNGSWTSSLFVSLDQVALESVIIDFCRTEQAIQSSEAMTEVQGSVDNYLHEAAMADDAPSGTIYDPEGDDSPLASLGVHEHWNNATVRQYTRNLGTGQGIELVTLDSTGTVDLLRPSRDSAVSDELGLKTVQLRGGIVIFEIQGAKAGDAELTVSTVNGRTVWQQPVRLQEGTDRVSWNPGTEMNGSMYVVSFTQGTRKAAATFAVR